MNRSADGGNWETVATLEEEAPAFSDSALDGSTEYCYEIVAINDIGDSSASAATCATTDAAGVAPAAPGAAGAASISTSGIDVSWTEASDNEDKFIVERQGGSASWSTVATLPANSTTYASRDLTASTSYCYRVSATNTFGNSAVSLPACATTAAEEDRGDCGDGAEDGGGGDGGEAGGGGGQTIPRGPKRLRGAGRYVGGIDLNWIEGANNETGFKIYRRAKHSSNGYAPIGTAGTNARSFTDDSVGRHKTYCYVVSAINGAGESSTSRQKCTRSR